MRVVVLSLLLFGLTLTASAAPAPLPRRAKADLLTFEGTWKMTCPDDPVSDSSDALTILVIVRGNKMTFRYPEGSRVPQMHAEFSGRPTAQPSPMSVRFLDHGPGGEADEEQNAKGLSKIEGGVWTLSLTRPEPFADQPPERLVLTRVGR